MRRADAGSGARPRGSGRRAASASGPAREHRPRAPPPAPRARREGPCHPFARGPATARRGQADPGDRRKTSGAACASRLGCARPAAIAPSVTPRPDGQPPSGPEGPSTSRRRLHGHPSTAGVRRHARPTRSFKRLLHDSHSDSHQDRRTHQRSIQRGAAPSSRRRGPTRSGDPQRRLTFQADAQAASRDRKVMRVTNGAAETPPRFTSPSRFPTSTTSRQTASPRRSPRSGRGGAGRVALTGIIAEERDGRRRAQAPEAGHSSLRSVPRNLRWPAERASGARVGARSRRCAAPSSRQQSDSHGAQAGRARARHPACRRRSIARGSLGADSVVLVGICRFTPSDPLETVLRRLSQLSSCVCHQRCRGVGRQSMERFVFHNQSVGSH